MMKMKFLLMLLAIALVAGTAQANMLLNPGFEEGAWGAGTPDFWVHYYTTYGPAHTWISSTAGAHSGSKYIKMNMWSWGSTAWLMQTLNVTAGQEYAFSVWAKCPVTAEISEAWGHYGWYNSVNKFISGGWLPRNPDVGSNWTYAEFGAVTAPADTRQVIFSIITGPENSVMGVLYDDACMSTPLPSFPSPAWESLVPVGDVDLSWTNMPPNAPATSVYVDVLFGTEPNETDTAYNMVPQTLEPASGQDVTSVTVNVPDLETYYWQVNSYIYGDPNDVNYTSTDPNSSPLYPIIEGNLWSFDIVSDASPSFVGASVDMITWSDEPVDLDATVVDDGKSFLTRAWSSYNLPGANVLFSDPNIVDPTVTITLDSHSDAAITNPSFEDFLIGWDIYVAGGYVGTWDGSFSDKDYIVPTDGGYCAWLSGDQGDGIVGAWISQTLTDTLAADTTYTLTVDVVDDGYYNEDVEYKVQLLAGETVIAEDDDGHPLPIDGVWETSVVSVTIGNTPADPNFAYVGQPLGIRLVAKVDTDEMSFDNVHLTADPKFPTPEFSTVELTIRASDEANPTYVLKDSMTIDVYRDACKAAIGADPQAIDKGDINKDCETNFADLREMAMAWLDDSALTEPVVK